MLAVVILKRTYKNNCTYGTVTLPDETTIVTMERPWLNNIPNKSCIPAGVYTCKWLERSASGRYKRCWHVQDVPGRSGILWHKGNLVRHTLGCILPGMKKGTLENSPAVLSSGNAMARLREALGGDDFLLVVT